jgi:hypothetical protein
LRRYRLNEATQLGQRVNELAGILENRSLVIVLSDLHDEASIPALRRMAQAHDTVVLQLQDPAERGRIGGGIFRAREAESGHAFVGHGSSRWLDADYAVGELRRGGVDHFLLRTDEVFLPKLRAFMKRRDNHGRGAR